MKQPHVSHMCHSRVDASFLFFSMCFPFFKETVSPTCFPQFAKKTIHKISQGEAPGYLDAFPGAYSQSTFIG